MSSAAPDPRSLPALHRIAALATRLDSADPALREILAIAVETFRADAGAIALLNPDTGRLDTEVSTADLAPEPSLKPGRGVTGWCVLHRRSLLVPDVRAEPRYIAARAAARCEMAVPLLDGDQILGVIDLESDHLSGFSHADLALLETLAAEATRVLQRLWRLDRLANKARQLESLVAAGQSLVTKLAPADLFATLTRAAGDLLRARACAFHLHDPAAGTLHRVFLEGIDAPPAAPLPLDACLLATAVHTRRALACLDLHSPDYAELADVPRDTALCSLLATPVLADGEVLGVIAVFTGSLHRFDDDEKRLCATLASLGAVAHQNARLYARVFQSEDVLRKNERLTTLGLLAAELAHEIRNPLTVLKLLHGGLGADFPPDDPRRTDLRVIAEKLDQLEGIVTRVLGFAQSPATLHSRCSLSEIVEDTLLLVRLKLAQGKVAVTVTPPPRPLFVEAHKGQIQQVLLNLLLNATHAMPDGGAIAITLSADESPGAPPRALLDIRDTGTGVDPAIRDRIFDSFLSGRPGGTGLGLAIAKRILSGHHGDIALLATGPAGTTMRVTLPLVP